MIYGSSHRLAKQIQRSGNDGMGKVGHGKVSETRDGPGWSYRFGAVQVPLEERDQSRELGTRNTGDVAALIGLLGI